MPKVLILIPLFVSERSLARTHDLLDALIVHEDPADFEILFVLDGKNRNSFFLPSRHQHLKIHTTSNPRSRQSNGWSGGLICGLIRGMKTALNLDSWDFLLRMDDDAMVLRPFITRATDYFSENPNIGQVGFYEFGTPPKPGEYHFFAGPFYRRSKLIRYHQDVGGLWIACFGWRRRVRLMINDAVHHGYAHGEFCQGGAFFLSRAAVDAMCRSRHFQNEKLFGGCTFTEDFFFAIANRAAGFAPRYVSDEDHFLSLKWKGLHKTPEQLLAEGHALVHSVKDDETPEKEERVRELFRRERERSAA